MGRIISVFAVVVWLNSGLFRWFEGDSPQFTNPLTVQDDSMPTTCDRPMKAAGNLKFNQEPDQICKHQLHTRKIRPFVTYIDPQNNEIAQNLAIPPPQKHCLFTPVPIILSTGRLHGHDMPSTRRVLSRNKEKIQVLPSHHGDIELLSVYPSNLNGIMQVIVLRIWSGDEICSTYSTGLQLLLIPRSNCVIRNETTKKKK